MNVEQIKTALEDRIIKVVAARTNIPYQTLIRIADGTTKNPKYSDTVKLIEYFDFNK